MCPLRYLFLPNLPSVLSFFHPYGICCWRARLIYLFCVILHSPLFPLCDMSCWCLCCQMICWLLHAVPSFFFILYLLFPCVACVVDIPAYTYPYHFIHCYPCACCWCWCCRLTCFCTIILLYVLCPRCGMGCWYCRSSVSSFRFFFIVPLYVMLSMIWTDIQSTLVISNSEILRDIRTSTYQICRIEKKKIIPTTTFNKYICNWRFEVRDVLKILWKRGEIAPKEQFLLFFTIFFTCC